MEPPSAERSLAACDTWTDEGFALGRSTTWPPGETRTILRSSRGIYRLLAPLGGPHGQVYLAEDAREGRSVVAKVLPTSLPERLRAAEHELKALLTLQMPGVVKLIDHGEADRAHFLVLEHIRGRRFPLLVDWHVVVERARCLLGTIRHFHERSIAHGDLKPSNVLVTESGAVVIIDLALASGGPLGDPRADPRVIHGTPAYMAPEMFCPELASACSDLYAVGLMLYEALTGWMPNPPNGGLTALIRARQTVDAPPLRVHAPEVPEFLARLVHRMLARDPSKRPSAEEALAAIEAGGGHGG